MSDALAVDHELAACQVLKVPIERIDVPDEWRHVQGPKVASLAESIERQGLLQPIGVWPRDGGRYRLTFGRHRLMAVERLGWTTIDARALEFARDEQRQLATDAENVYRSELEPAEQIVALKRLRDAYVRANPETAASHADRARQRHEERRAGSTATPGPERPKRFDQAVAERTGESPSNVRRKLTTADRLGELPLKVLTGLGLTESELKRLADVEDPAAREKAVRAVSLGADVDAAIAEHTAAGNVHVEDVAAEDDERAEAEHSEDDLSDDQWLQKFCGKVLARLKYTHAYRRDAILYRHTREARATLRNKAKKPLALSKTRPNGAFARLMIHFLYVDHPCHWLACAACQGTGMIGDQGKCRDCKGDAFQTTQQKGAR
jgi:ParB family chromosome partitioning protein